MGDRTPTLDAPEMPDQFIDSGVRNGLLPSLRRYEDFFGQASRLPWFEEAGRQRQLGGHLLRFGIDHGPGAVRRGRLCICITTARSGGGFRGARVCPAIAFRHLWLDKTAAALWCSPRSDLGATCSPGPVLF